MERTDELIDDGMCFACGPRNDIGLRLEFEAAGGDIVTRFLPQDRHQGFQGIVHGGILSTLLDEVMAHVLMRRGIRAVTARMEVQFKQIARVDELRSAVQRSHRAYRIVNASAQLAELQRFTADRKLGAAGAEGCRNHGPLCSGASSSSPPRSARCSSSCF